MISRLALLLVAAMALIPGYGWAWHELGQAELREKVRSGDSMSLASVLRRVRKSVPGEAVDVRAVSGDGVFFRILVMRPNGKLTTVVVDASTGAVVPNNSALGRAVTKAVRESSSKRSSGKVGGAGNNKPGKSSIGGNSGNGGGNSGGGNSGNGGGNGGGKGGK